MDTDAGGFDGGVAPSTASIGQSDAIKRIVAFQLRHSPHTSVIALQDKITDLYSLLMDVAEGHQFSSVALLGPPATGKTLCLRCCLRKYRTECNKLKLVLVQISGSLVETNLDGLLQIASQLDAKLKTDYSNTISDTAATDDGLSGSIPTSRRNPNVDNGSQMVNELLLEHKTRGGCVILWITKFEQFVEKAPRALYSLLDFAHTSSVPMMLVCETDDQGVLDSMEKRITSRFSVREILFHNYSLNDMLCILQRLLSINAPPPAKYLVTAEEWPVSIKSYVRSLDLSILQQYNDSVKSTLEDQTVKAKIESLLGLGRDLRFFLRVFGIAIMRLPSDRIRLSPDGVISACDELLSSLVGYQIAVLRDLSQAERDLVKILQGRDPTPTSFETLYALYAQKHSGNMTNSLENNTCIRNEDQFANGFRMLPKGPSLHLFEQLLDLEIATIVEKRKGRTQVDRLGARLSLHSSEVSQASIM